MRRVTSDADLAVACPLCHAQPGRPCGWKGATYAGVVHRERKREAETMHGGRLHQCDCPDVPDLSARVGSLPENWQEQLATELDVMEAATARINRLASEARRGRA